MLNNSSPQSFYISIFVQGAPTNNRAILAFTPVGEQLAATIAQLAALAPASSGNGSSRRTPNVHVVGLRYPPSSSGYTPIFVTGSPRAAALSLLGQPPWAQLDVSVLRLPEGHDPQPTDFNTPGEGDRPRPTAPASLTAAGGPAALKFDDSDAAPSTWSGAVREALAQLLRGSRTVALSAMDYNDFCAFYAKWRGGLKGA